MASTARPGERYLGFGERSNAVDQRGNEVEDYVSDGPYAPADRGADRRGHPAAGLASARRRDLLPGPVAALHRRLRGPAGGNDETSYFRLGSSDPIRLERRGPGDRTSASASSPAPAPADALRRLTEITGRQPPPAAPWVFGPWYQPTGDDQLGQARALRAADVPGSAVNTYLHYLPCGAQQGVESQQPPFTTGFHDLGYAITTYFNPMICTSYQPAYSQAAAAGVLNTNQLDQPYVYNLNTGNLSSPVSQFDFTAPGTQSFWDRLLSEAVGHGYDGWMEDFGEYTPLDANSADGTPGTRMHNLYPTRYHCATYALCPRRAAPGGARSCAPGWTGTRRCAADRLGRRPDHRLGLRRARLGDQAGALAWGRRGSRAGALTSAATSALFDRRKLTPELLDALDRVRRRLGVMRTEANGFTLASYAAAAGARRRRCCRSGAATPSCAPSSTRTWWPPTRTTGATGMPLMRDLALVYPDDTTASGERRRVHVRSGPAGGAGPPAWADGASVYLPAGRWIDFWRALSYQAASGAFRLRRAPVVTGGRSISVPAPLDQLPLMVRAGAILPLLPPTTQTLSGYGSASTVGLDDVRNRLHLVAFPRGKSRSAFGENGGLRSKERRHSWRLTIRRAQKHRIVLDASLGTLRHKLAPCGVRVDGRRLRRRAWSAKKGVLHVRFRSPGKVTHLTVLDRTACRRR